MMITLVMVQSLDGKTTKQAGTSTHGWSSAEDRIQFHNLIEKHSLIVMGSTTYDHVKQEIRPSPDRLRIVLTRNAKKYAGHAIPGQLEFSEETPAELVTRMEKLGHTGLLLAGGSKTNELFLTAHLITRMIVTIEPLIHGKGNSLFTDAVTEAKLRLIDIKRLNDAGTLRLEYTVSYEN